MPSLSSRERSYALADKTAPPPFEHVICGVDATPASREAVRQAATIAGRGGRVLFVCAEPNGHDGVADDRALAEAIATAEDLGAAPTGQLFNGAGPVYALLERAGPDDLVVVGSHGTSRPAGILSGSTATTLLHRAESAVLIARPASNSRPFPRELLVASDGSATSSEAVRLAAAIARRHHARVSHLHAGLPDRELQAVLNREVVALGEAAETPPAVLLDTDVPHSAIVARARDRRCSLVIVGRRGLSGVRALGSVSERVGHEAPCSVLVTRPPGRR